MKASLVCPVCGVVTVRQRAAQVYCGQACRLAAMAARNRSDPEAQRSRGRLGGAARGAQLRAEKPTKGYRKDRGRHEHRRVAEECLGRPLRPGEVVHHRDEVKTNNHPSNLIVFPSQAVHARHHKLNHGKNDCACPGIRLGVI